MAKYDLNNIYEWPITTRYLIVGLLCVVVFYLGYMWDIADMKARIANNQTKVADLKTQLEFVIDKEAKIEKETAQLPKLEENLIEWQKKLVNYGDLPELLSEILKIGANNQLHFILFNPGDEKKVDLYVKVPIKIIVVGGYHQLATFVSQVANMPLIVAIGNFSISKENKSDTLGAKLANDANDSNLLTAEFEFDIYHLIMPGAVNAQ